MAGAVYCGQYASVAAPMTNAASSELTPTDSAMVTTCQALCPVASMSHVSCPTATISAIEARGKMLCWWRFHVKARSVVESGVGSSLTYAAWVMAGDTAGEVK